jgi:hypothetical protein
MKARAAEKVPNAIVEHDPFVDLVDYPAYTDPMLFVQDLEDLFEEELQTLSAIAQDVAANAGEVLQERAAEAPAAEAPAVEAPVTEAPAVEDAVTEAPAVEDAVAEAPAVEDEATAEPKALPSGGSTVAAGAQSLVTRAQPLSAEARRPAAAKADHRAEPFADQVVHEGDTSTVQALNLEGMRPLCIKCRWECDPLRSRLSSGQLALRPMQFEADASHSPLRRDAA